MLTEQDKNEIKQMIEHALNERGVAYPASATAAIPIPNPCFHEWYTVHTTTGSQTYCKKCYVGHNGGAYFSSIK